MINKTKETVLSAFLEGELNQEKTIESLLEYIQDKSILNFFLSANISPELKERIREKHASLVGNRSTYGQILHLFLERKNHNRGEKELLINSILVAEKCNYPYEFLAFYTNVSRFPSHIQILLKTQAKKCLDENKKILAK